MTLPWRSLTLTQTLILAWGMAPSFGHANPGQEPAPPPGTQADRDQLRRYAGATWRSFAAMAAPDGLPADELNRDDAGTWRPSGQTSPTDIGAYLWSTLAAHRLALIDRAEAARRVDATLTTLGVLEREHGFFFNRYDVRSHQRLGIPVGQGKPPRHFLSTVDNGWLAASLVLVRNTWPEFRDRADRLLEPMNFRFFYEPFDPADPDRHPGQFHGGYYTDDQTFTACYGMLNTEPRIVSYLAIARGQVPPEHYYRLFRTLSPAKKEQHAVPVGVTRTYRDVPVFEGHYDVRGSAVVPSWGGSMFEALMVPLFVPEARWAPQSWGVNHPLYVRLQVEQGMQRQRYATWGFSPCRTPEGGYATYGVADLGTAQKPYQTFEIPAHQGKDAAVEGKSPVDGVVTPHASFLALPFAPREALANLRHLEQTYPIFGVNGFADSVNVTTGRVSATVLSLDQGMILAAIANALADDAMQHAFADGPIEAAIRPLIAFEAFTAADR